MNMLYGLCCGKLNILRYFYVVTNATINKKCSLLNKLVTHKLHVVFKQSYRIIIISYQVHLTIVDCFYRRDGSTVCRNIKTA